MYNFLGDNEKYVYILYSYVYNNHITPFLITIYFVLKQ